MSEAKSVVTVEEREAWKRERWLDPDGRIMRLFRTLEAEEKRAAEAEGDRDAWKRAAKLCTQERDELRAKVVAAEKRAEEAERVGELHLRTERGIHLRTIEERDQARADLAQERGRFRLLAEKFTEVCRLMGEPDDGFDPGFGDRVMTRIARLRSLADAAKTYREKTSRDWRELIVVPIARQAENEQALARLPGSLPSVAKRHQEEADAYGALRALLVIAGIEGGRDG